MRGLSAASRGSRDRLGREVHAAFSRCGLETGAYELLICFRSPLPAVFLPVDEERWRSGDFEIFGDRFVGSEQRDPLAAGCAGFDLLVVNSQRCGHILLARCKLRGILVYRIALGVD